jgi:hypothetical protein
VTTRGKLRGILVSTTRADCLLARRCFVVVRTAKHRRAKSRSMSAIERIRGEHDEFESTQANALTASDLDLAERDSRLRRVMRTSCSHAPLDTRVGWPLIVLVAAPAR